MFGMIGGVPEGWGAAALCFAILARTSIMFVPLLGGGAELAAGGGGGARYRATSSEPGRLAGGLPGGVVDWSTIC